MNFRTAVGTVVLHEDTGHEYSNFRLVDREFASRPVMRRVLSLARKLNYQSILIEEIVAKDCELLAEEDAALHVRMPEFTRSRVRRLTFFSEPKAVIHPPSHAFLGYAIFKQDFSNAPNKPIRSYIYESVLRPPRSENENNFMHCQRTYRIRTPFGQFDVTGVLYAQQNNSTFVCAHVALRTALSSVLPEADITYGEINRILGIDHLKKKIGRACPKTGDSESGAIIRHTWRERVRKAGVVFRVAGVGRACFGKRADHPDMVRCRLFLGIQ